MGYYGVDTLSQLRSSVSSSDIVEPIDARAIAMDYDVGLSICSIELAAEEAQSSSQSVSTAVHPAATSFDIWKARLTPLRALERFFATNDKNHYFSNLHRCVTRDGVVCWTTHSSILLLEQNASKSDKQKTSPAGGTAKTGLPGFKAPAAKVDVPSTGCSCVVC